MAHQNGQQPQTGSSRRPTAAFVFGGGGGFGVGFNHGVADGFADEGLSLFDAALMGTSAGSIVAGSVVAGLGFDRVAEEWETIDAQRQSPWRFDPRLLTEPLFGAVDPATFPTELRTVAVHLRRVQRVVMTTNHFQVADMVAASCAIPPVVQTVVIDGERYGDGGLVSNSSADLATDADVLVLVTPLTRPIRGVTGAFNSWRTRAELRKWVRRTGGRVLHVPPTEQIAELFSAKLTDIANIEIARRAYPLSRAYGRRMAAAVRAMLADVEVVGEPGGPVRSSAEKI